MPEWRPIKPISAGLWSIPELQGYSSSFGAGFTYLPDWRHGVDYSLVGSYKLNDIDPFAYFNDVLRRVSTHPAEKIDELLPGKWKPPLKKAEISEEDIAA